MRSISLLVASFFGVGCISRKAPGTVGSFVATLLCILLWKLPVDCFRFSVFLILFFAGTLACYCHIREDKSSLDPGYVVIDEVVAVFLGAVVIITHMKTISITDLIAVSILFRVFDIWKPFPIKQIENFCKKSGSVAIAAFGIMIDDIVAVLFAVLLWNFAVIFKLE
jgi:phosphatidylglycerophosphatase A